MIAFLGMYICWCFMRFCLGDRGKAILWNWDPLSPYPFAWISLALKQKKIPVLYNDPAPWALCRGFND